MTIPAIKAVTPSKIDCASPNVFFFLSHDLVASGFIASPAMEFQA
jgi:hypothetical protein